MHINIYRFLIVFFAVAFVGCGFIKDEPKQPILPQPPTTDVEDFLSPSEEEPDDAVLVLPGEAVELERGGEEYDYSGWEIAPGVIS